MNTPSYVPTNSSPNRCAYDIAIISVHFTRSTGSNHDFSNRSLKNTNTTVMMHCSESFDSRTVGNCIEDARQAPKRPLSASEEFVGTNSPRYQRDEGQEQQHHCHEYIEMDFADDTMYGSDTYRSCNNDDADELSLCLDDIISIKIDPPIAKRQRSSSDKHGPRIDRRTNM
jgi:hypothetical protein